MQAMLNCVGICFGRMDVDGHIQTLTPTPNIAEGLQ